MEINYIVVKEIKSSFNVCSIAIPRSNVKVTPGVFGMSKKESTIVFAFGEVRCDVSVLQ